MWELISQERYREQGIPVDLGPYHNHGSRFDTHPVPGATAGKTAIDFPNAHSRVSIGLGVERQWIPLVALRIEVVAKINPGAAFVLTLVEGDGAFRFEINQTALAASVPGPAGTATYIRSDAPWAPDGLFHAVPANRWVTLGFNHDGYSNMQVLIDGRVVGETTVSTGVPPVQGGGVSIGNNVAGGRPLLGAVDEVRVWRLYPKGIEQEFWCRPQTATSARCWEEIFRAVRDWGTTHPADLQSILSVLSAQIRALVRAQFLLPADEQAKIRAILRDYRRLWCQGRIDGPEMRGVVQRWVAALRSHGLDPAMGPLDSELQALLQRTGIDPKLLSLHCDPAAAAFLRLLEQKLEAS